jgi:uncharacterized membrane protein YfcA
VLSGSAWLGAALAGMAGGLLNALAGGGSLISFPVLTALGLSPLVANLTNTVALTPGYLGAAWVQRRHLAGQGGRIRLLVPAASLGGLLGGWLLLRSDERLFAHLVPWLILFGSALLGLQPSLRALLRPQDGSAPDPRRERQLLGLALAAVALAAIYGGYFGAGLSVIFLAVLGLTFADNLTRLNGLKQLLSFVTNLGATVVLVSSGRVDWPMAVVVAMGSIVGGQVGGAVANRVNGEALRWLVVVLGVGIGLWFLRR